MAFDVYLYNSSAEPERVDKTNYLTNKTTFNGTLRSECNMVTPDIIIESTTFPTWNYAEIPSFNRFYYITSITSVATDIWRISLSCDVLMTYKTDIQALNAIIARQEFDYNLDLQDTLLPAEVETETRIINIPSTAFDVSTALTYKFMLAVLGAA